MKKALTIAGSDSSAGAGIQADLKTFSALGLYCTTVLTVLTAQNTKTVSDIFIVPSTFFKEQLISTINDIKPDIIKIAVLYDNSIIDIVFDILYPLKIPIVLDPVFVSGTGIKLLKDNSFSNFKKKIIPISFVITPNIKEAETLTNQHISSENELIEAIYKIMELGVDNVIVKGVPDFNNISKIYDILLEKESNTETKIYTERLKITETHGTGCNFSSSLASFIGKGHNIRDAFFLANEYVKEGLANSIEIGQGIRITNPLTKIYEYSSRFKIILALNNSVTKLEEIKGFYMLIPETKTNFVYSLESPQSFNDVAGIKGRITNIDLKIRTPNIIEFGASIHVANAVISANKINNSIRSAINIKKDEKILSICKENFKCSFYSRQEEKSENKVKEGMSISWGINKALEKNPTAEIVYHDGDYGKEPMIIIFGKSPEEVLDKIKIIMLNTSVF
jgi:hydroxymethylpyrimidine/phosphomethylpyrimidine kinase